MRWGHQCWATSGEDSVLRSMRWGLQWWDAHGEDLHAGVCEVGTSMLGSTRWGPQCWGPQWWGPALRSTSGGCRAAAGSSCPWVLLGVPGVIQGVPADGSGRWQSDPGQGAAGEGSTVRINHRQEPHMAAGRSQMGTFVEFLQGIFSEMGGKCLACCDFEVFAVHCSCILRGADTPESSDPPCCHRGEALEQC